MYMWMNHIISPKANAGVAEWFGEAPANKKSCAETADKDHCDTFHAEDEAYFDKVAFWTTPTKSCGDDRGAGLQGLLRMGGRLDGGEGLIGPASGAHCATTLHRRPRLRLSLLLAGPVGWLVVAYLGSLAVLFVAAFWQLDPFSAEVVHEYGLQNFETIAEGEVYRTIVLRTVGIAAAVTVTDAILAFPIAFYMAKVASPRVRAPARRRGADAAVVELPREGLRVAHDPVRGRDPQLGARAVRAARARATATWRRGSSSRYLWLPFMILPIYAGPRADPQLAARRLRRPRRRRRPHVPPRDPAAGLPGDRRRARSSRSR